MINFKTLSLLFVLTGIVNVACGSQKTLVKNDTLPDNPTGVFQKEAYFKKINANKSKEDCLTAKIKCVVSMDGKNTSTSGHLRMKKDDVIQISLLDPIAGLLELIRIEFTKDMMLMVDRYNKKYIYVPYDQVDFLKKCDIDFIALENLFWNHIFVPAKQQAEPEDFLFETTESSEPVSGLRRKNGLWRPLSPEIVTKNLNLHSNTMTLNRSRETISPTRWLCRSLWAARMPHFRSSSHLSRTSLDGKPEQKSRLNTPRRILSVFSAQSWGLIKK